MKVCRNIVKKLFFVKKVQCLDATYKLLELGPPTYLMLCEDSNGQSEIIAVCLLVTEDSFSMTWMMNTFKKENTNWEKSLIVMADEDSKERDAIKQCLPNASIINFFVKQCLPNASIIIFFVSYIA